MKHETKSNGILEMLGDLPCISYHHQKPENISFVLLTVCRLLILQRFSVEPRAPEALASPPVHTPMLLSKALLSRG